MTGPSGALLDLAYGYDAAGNLTSRTDQAAGGRRTAAFGYDHLGRLTWAQHGSATRRYELDPIGNLTRTLVDEGQPTQGEVLFTYDLNPSGGRSPLLSGQEIRQGGVPVASFTAITDPAGNVTSDGLAVYDYGVRNTLAERRLGAATTVHTMGADGLRARSTRLDTGAVTDIVLGPGLQRLSRIRAGSIRDYVFLGGELIAYFDDGASEPVQVITDHIGFPLQAIDAQGTVRWDALSEVSGELREPFSRAFDPGLRYPGQWQDETDLEADCSGDTCTPRGPLTASPSLYENGYRWYRPQWGRYTQADPITEVRPGASRNRHYVYADENPLGYVDRFGLCTEGDLCPTGKWQYQGNPISGGEAWVGVWLADFGISGFGGQYRCLNECGFPLGQAEVRVHVACEVENAIGFDIGLDLFETSMGQVEDACNADDLLGTVTGHLISLPVFGFGKLGEASPWTVEASISVGLGYAQVTCRILKTGD